MMTKEVFEKAQNMCLDVDIAWNSVSGYSVEISNRYTNGRGRELLFYIDGEIRLKKVCKKALKYLRKRRRLLDDK